MSKFTRVILLNFALLMCFSVVGCGKDQVEPFREPTQTPASSVTATGTPAGSQDATKPTANVPTKAPTKAPSVTTPTKKPVATPAATPTVVEGEGAVLYQVAVKDALSMSYVIRTKNNKIIVIDGGGDSNSGTFAGKKYPKKEIDELLRVLREATGQQVPTIDAWILTHCHSDHINAFSHMSSNMKGTVKVKKVYYNFPTDSYMYQFGEMGTDSDSTLSKFKKAIATYSDNQIVIVQKGASYTVDNVTFNIILTPEENNVSLRSNAINESSIVFDMKLGGQRVLFLGDLGPFSSTRFRNAMRRTESPFVDVVQMAHHGSQGILKEYYWTLEPKVCLWPTPDWLWMNTENGLETKDVYNYLVSKGVRKHYVMKDGTVKLTFPLSI